MTDSLAPLVLLVEDEPAQRQVLAYNLRAQGLRVAEAAGGEEALLMVAECEPDLIVLDWMLPELSGIEVCRRLKAARETREIPVIMLSARSEETDLVRGLDTGADDYVTKPYSVAELMARVRGALRRLGRGEALEAGGLRLEIDTRRLFCEGREIRLGPTEFRLLAVLMARPGQVFSRDRLLDRVWGQGAELSDRTVDVHVGRLRRALRAAGAGEAIRTVRGSGYAFG